LVAALVVVHRPDVDPPAGLGDGQLHAQVATVNGIPQATPGFLAWLEPVTDPERDRRAGRSHPLQGIRATNGAD
jgi:hypothetical protein